MDNKTMARLLAETADLLEIDGADSFRIRSYRRAAEAAEQTTVDLTEAAADTARLMEIDGIGKSMAAKLQAIAATGSLEQRDELLAKAPEVAEVLNRPAGKVDDGTMARLNYEVAGNKRSPEEVAREFLKAKGWIK